MPASPRLSSRPIAAIATAIAALVLLLLLLLVHLSMPARRTESRQPVASACELPEFVEVELPEPVPEPAAASAPAPAPSPTPAPRTPRPQNNASRPAATPPGPTPQQRAAEEATRDVTDAFADPGPDNSSDIGPEPGDSGRPDAASNASGSAASGTVDGGWIMPAYAKISSTRIGSIRLRVEVDAQGNPRRIVQIGGDPPASADRALVAACIAEVRAHRFTRSDSNPPELATATITYIFR